MDVVASDRVRELKSVLDRIIEQNKFVGDCTPDEWAQRNEAVDTFVRGGPDLLDQATPFLWEYYRRTTAEFTAEERAAYAIPNLSDSAGIWQHVTFAAPAEWCIGGGPLSPGGSYLSFEGNVSWEPEHGLQLTFEDGRLCKVGPYDGHVTNAHAYGDPSLLGVIFR